MYLKSLKLHGFKSFANRTEFEFHLESPVLLDWMWQSNVVDAIRWCRGNIRQSFTGGEMADVIFNGTDKGSHRYS